MGHKRVFCISDPRAFGMPKQLFLAHFEPEMKRIGAWKIANCLEKGPFCEQKWVKNAVRPKVIVDHLWCTNK